jgi:hypothetical protein
VVNDDARRSGAEQDPGESPETPVTPEAAEGAGGGVAHGDEPGAGRRPAVPRGRLAVAAVTAAVLVAGGVGTYVTSSAGGPAAASPSDASEPEPLPLDGYGAVPQGLHIVAPDGSLPQGPDTAPVYRPGGEVPRDRVAALAGALGLESTPRAEGAAWKAGDGLVVNRKAPGSWTFTRAVSGGKTPVSEERARSAAAPVLKAAGQDDGRVDASGTLGAERTVNVEPLVGGLPTHGWTTSLRVGPDASVTSGAGQLAAPVRGDAYPVVGAGAALKEVNRLSAAVGGAPGAGCASAVPHSDGGGEGRPSAEVPPVDPCTPEDQVKRRTATVESAEFGLAAHFVDGRQTLVPSWLFRVRVLEAGDLLTLSHPAVEPAYLTTPGGTPTERPSPRPTGPDDGTGTDRARVTGYRAEDGRLTVAFEAGVCSDFTVRTEERGDRVRVTVVEKKWDDRVCVMIAKIHHRTVELAEPLGDRTVVDQDGRTVPPEKEPRPSTR